MCNLYAFYAFCSPGFLRSELSLLQQLQSLCVPCTVSVCSAITSTLSVAPSMVSVVSLCRDCFFCGDELLLITQRLFVFVFLEELSITTEIQSTYRIHQKSARQRIVEKKGLSWQFENLLPVGDENRPVGHRKEGYRSPTD